MPITLPLKDQLIVHAQDIFKSNLRQGYSSWRKSPYRFIAPSSIEYVYQWLWDTAFHAIVLSHFDIEWAKSEIRNFLLAQRSDGFLPHVIFWGDKKILPHWAYIESALSIRPTITSITQPPALALAVEAIYQKQNDKAFLHEVLDKLGQHHKWLMDNRDLDGDGLLSIISPNESGLDELPVFQYAVGFYNEDTVRLHYYYRRGDLLNQLYRFNSKVILQKDYFSVEELMFNCVFIEASRSLGRLYREIGDLVQSDYFSRAAEKAEKTLLAKCWHEEDKIFYSLFSKDKKPARVKTVTSLMPLFLDGLSGDKLYQLVQNHLLNSNEFWTSYPIPSVAKDERYYTPTDTPLHKVKLLWRGPTWINTNWFVIKGLRKHGFHEIADLLVARTCEMIQKWGYREYYNPETGEGYRRENFGWSTLILDLL